MINSTGNFFQQYGVFEARLKLLNNSGMGLHPTFWLLGEGDYCWPSMGEVDVVEVSGRNYRQSGHHTEYATNLHAGAPGCCSHNCSVNEQTWLDWDEPPNHTLDDWHVWSFHWNRTSMTTFLDGKVVGQTTNSRLLSQY